MTRWRSAHNRRRRAMKRELKQARLRRLTPWQRNLIAAFERVRISCGVATIELRKFGKIAETIRVNTMSPDAADAFAYGVSGLPIRLTMP